RASVREQVDVPVIVDVNRYEATLDKAAGDGAMFSLEGAVALAIEDLDSIAAAIAQEIDHAVAIDVDQGTAAAERVETMRGLEIGPGPLALPAAVIAIEHTHAVAPGAEQVDLAVFVEVVGHPDLAAGVGNVVIETNSPFEVELG